MTIERFNGLVIGMWIIALVAAGALIGRSILPPAPRADDGRTIEVFGCPSEDSCSIDYQGGEQPRWVITSVTR